MELELSPDQKFIQTSLDKLLEKYRTPPHDDTSYAQHNAELRRELLESGYLGICLQDGYGLIDAALTAENIARLPWSVEATASALLPHALGFELDGAVALCEGLNRPTRYLPYAQHAVVATNEGIYLSQLAEDNVRVLESVLAYPVGVLEKLPENCELLAEDVAEKVRTLWWLAIATEGSGLMRGALDLTVSYVKDRQQFKRPLGDFQAIQHRLSGAEQIVDSSFLLAMRAASSQSPLDAATAALYVQQQMRTVIYDCHQFTGAMGLTLEYPLHLWTYRLKFLQGELGGFPAQAAAVARLKWFADAA